MLERYGVAVRCEHTISTLHHKHIGARSGERDGNKGPDFEGALAGLRLRATLARGITSSRWGVADWRADSPGESIGK